MAEVAEVSEVAMVAMVAMVAVVRGSRIHCNYSSRSYRHKNYSIQTVRARVSLRGSPKSRAVCQRCLGSQR